MASLGTGGIGVCRQERGASLGAVPGGMKMILDESTPQKLRLLIHARHIVVTTWFQGWSGLKNGTLLAAADDAGFDLFITADQELSYQQNLAGRRIAVLVLSTNNWSVVKEQASRITAAIDATTPGA